MSLPMEVFSRSSSSQPSTVLPSRPRTPLQVVQQAIQLQHPECLSDASALPPGTVAVLTPPSCTRAQSSDESTSSKAQTTQSMLLELEELTKQELGAYQRWTDVNARLRSENVRYLAACNERREATARLAEARERVGYPMDSEKDAHSASDTSGDGGKSQDVRKALQDRLAYLNQWLANVSPLNDVLNDPEASSKHATEIYIPLGLYDRERYKRYVLSSSERKAVVKYRLILGLPSSSVALSSLPEYLLQARDGLWGNHFENHWFLLLPEKGHGLFVCRQCDVRDLDQLLNAKTANSTHLEVTVTRWGEDNRYYVGSFLPLLRWLPFNKGITGLIPEAFGPESFRPGTGECAFERLKVQWHNEKNDLLFCVLEFVKFNERYVEEVEKFVAGGAKAM